MRRNAKRNSLSVDAVTTAGLRILKKYPMNGQHEEQPEPVLNPQLALGYDEPNIIISETFA
ncbi:MAG: hypothetical protein IPM46_16755 [Flavobacteriales bacterium]|nr:hypothetical protein [Flavobacteriales bacterium]